MTDRGRRSERGVTLVVFAFCILLLLTLVALAVDLGRARFASRDNQQAADLAALSAGYYLAGHGSHPSTSQPRAACRAAFGSVSTNLRHFDPSSATITSACSVLPADSTACDDTTATITASVSDAEYTVDVQWPVADSDLADSRFAGPGIRDGTDRCERMRLAVDRVQETAFARVIGFDTVASGGDAVVRGAPSANSQGIAALLLLEREGCGSLQRSGQGKVIVKTVTDPSTGDHQPGVIQSDSAGRTTAYGSGMECRTSGGGSPQANASGYVIYASCSGTNLPGIVAEATASGEPGVIATYAKEVGSPHHASCYSDLPPTGLNVEPIGSSVTSRRPADDRYNPSTRPAIGDLHAEAFADAVTNGAATSGTVLSANSDCNVNANRVFAHAGDVTLACGNAGFRVGNNQVVSFPSATSVKFVGGLDVGGGAQLDLPAATSVVVSRSSLSDSAPVSIAGTASFGVVRTFFVGGEPATCSPVGSCRSVHVTGTLRVNTGGIATESCADGPGSGGSATNWTRFATLGGSFDVSGSVSLCQTTLYVGRSQPTYSPSQRTTGGINCSVSLPCPVLSTAPSFDRVNVNGGGSSIVWSAPDETTTPPNAANPFEGLALWAEGTGLSQIKGTGTVLTTGVFFLPNAGFEFDGQASAANPFNAQFFSRAIDFSGQGDLNLSPDPRDAVPTPIPGSFSLIR